MFRIENVLKLKYNSIMNRGFPTLREEIVCGRNLCGTFVCGFRPNPQK